MYGSDTFEDVINITLEIPGLDFVLHPGDHIRIGRFSSEEWKVGYGWFAFGGNRKICGWFAQSESDTTRIKPIQETDLHDIYMVGR